MKISLNLIKEFVSLPEDLTMKQLAFDLTMSTVEVEDVVHLGKSFDNIVVGQILEIENHPTSNKLWICKVDIKTSVKTIVCGGINLSKGMKVAVALVGAKVHFHGEKDEVVIKLTNVRDVESEGMICASNEINLETLFPAKKEAEIIDLSAFDVEKGTSLAEFLNLENEVILDIDNKSLSNRPDLWGHFGVAREISAIYSLPLKSLESNKNSFACGDLVHIENQEFCKRYIALEIENVAVQESNFKLKTLLWRTGLRPINAIVDITNYIMIVTGQPTHAFDKNQISGKIIVRPAKIGESIKLLDGKIVELCEKDLVIADNKSILALAGIMGGINDSILPSSKNIVLEIANFNADTIRKTVLKNNTRTDASNRFEKGIDIERCDEAFALAVSLFSKVFPLSKIVSVSEKGVKTSKKLEIKLSLAWLKKSLGKNLSNEYIKEKLSSLGFQIQFNQDEIKVVVPSYRATGDVSIPNDILEEVARIHGFENFEPLPITTTFTSAINQTKIDLERKIKEYFAFRCGMQEVFNYPWVQDKFIDALNLDKNEMLELSAPPSPSEKYLRSSLIPNILKTVATNVKNFKTFSIFESAEILLNNTFSRTDDTCEYLPKQTKYIAGAFVSDEKAFEENFRKAKGVLENLSKHSHMQKFIFSKDVQPVWSKNVAWLNIKQCNKIVGNLAMIDKKTALECGIKNGNVVVFEINQDMLLPFTSRTNKFENPSHFPHVEYDLSLLFNNKTTWSEIQKVVQGLRNKLIKDVIYCDTYQGNQVPEGQKSLSFRLLIGSTEKTLTSEEIETVAKQVLNALENKLNGILRK